MVLTFDAFSPLPTVGLWDARSGGHAATHAPKQVLFFAESAVNM